LGFLPFLAAFSSTEKLANPVNCIISPLANASGITFISHLWDGKIPSPSGDTSVQL
jgi:hypothetical protein